MKNILDFIFIIGIGQGLLLVLALLKKKENRAANKLLAFTITALVIELGMALYISTGFYRTMPELIGMTSGFPYLYGPGFYLYITLLGHKRNGFRKEYLWHYLPFILVYLGVIILFMPQPAGFKIAAVEPDFKAPFYMNLVEYLIPVHGWIYTILTVRQSIRFNKYLKGSYSNIDKINIRWASFLAFGGMVVWGMVILGYILDAYTAGRIASYMLIYPSVALLIYALGYKALRRPDIVAIEPFIIETAEADTSLLKTETYRKSGLTEEQASEIAERLLGCMQEQKPYLDNNICLADLAAMVQVSIHNLSEVINTRQNENFYDFINRYRVEEVKRLIAADKARAFSLLAVGFEAGFSSKSAYYTAFRKITGMTPAKYRQSLEQPAG